MKRFIYIVLAVLLFATCTELDTPIVEESNNQKFQLDQNISQHRAMIKFDEGATLAKKFIDLKAANKERQLKISKVGCRNVAKVPKDFSTIQEAVDAVCEGGNVVVSTGTYNENVEIITANLFLQAEGEVILNGSFALDADKIKIHNFKIDATNSPYGVAIGSINNNGHNIRNNTIYGTGHLGIYFKHCDDSKIIENTISGDMEAAIYIDSFRFGAGFLDQSSGDSRNNFISNNNISNIIGDPQVFYEGYGIILRGDCDNNIIQENIVNGTNGWGIVLLSIPEFNENTDNNTVKSNIVRNNQYDGIDIYNDSPIIPSTGGSGNTIGPGNESFDNGRIGILLYYGSNHNYILNNTFKNNGFCDIVDLGFDNSYKNNLADCLLGVE